MLAPRKKKIVKRPKAAIIQAPAVELPAKRRAAIKATVKKVVAEKKPVPPVPVVRTWHDLTPVALEKAYSRLKTVNREYGTAVWEMISATGGVYSYAEVCHAALKTQGVNEIMFVPHGGLKLTEADREFIKWFVTDSPAAPLVINSDNVTECCERGVLWAYAYAKKTQTFWMAKSLRIITEENYRIQHWWRFVQLGVHPMTAFIAANILSNAGVYANAWTHANTFYDPPSVEALRSALTTKWKVGEKLLAPGRCGNSGEIFYRGFAGKKGIFKIGSSKQEKVSDGWGGFTYQKIASSVEEDAKLLIELTKEALKGD